MKLPPEYALAKRHPDYSRLALEEYNDWCTYGMLLGHAALSFRIRDLLAELDWLEQQHEAAQRVARAEAQIVFRANL